MKLEAKTRLSAAGDTVVDVRKVTDETVMQLFAATKKRKTRKSRKVNVECMVQTSYSDEPILMFGMVFTHTKQWSQWRNTAELVKHLAVLNKLAHPKSTLLLDTTKKFSMFSVLAESVTD